MELQTIRFALTEIFEHAAIWQSTLPSSGEGWKIFKRLAATVGQIDDETLAAYAELWEGEPDRLAHRQQLEAVATGSSKPSSASDFAARFVAERTGASREFDRPQTALHRRRSTRPP